MTMSCFLIVSAISAACLALYSAHLLGVAAGGLGLLELLVLDGDELAPRLSTCSLAGRADVGGGDRGAEPPGGGDGLQPGDAGAHHQHLGRRTVPAAVIIIGKARP
jgi:hypothetical protein